VAVVSPYIWTYVGAELLLLLVRSRDVKILSKRNDQRTAQEQKRVARGLKRSLILEALILVPASATLVLLISPLVLRVAVTTANLTAVYTLLGIGSYGFPFAAVRAFVRRVALITLKEFAGITTEHPNSDEI
jgi:hypothetical protein